jgi:farnesyl-diphosphate farnesyltransferase
MTDFAHRAAIAKTVPYLDTIAECDVYCCCVTGLIDEGLSRLWTATGKEQPRIAAQLVSSTSMGLLLQNTNTIRDFSKDCDRPRDFWPKEIWGRYGFVEQEDMSKEGNEEGNVSTRSTICCCSETRPFSAFALSIYYSYRYPRAMLYEPRRVSTEYQDSTRPGCPSMSPVLLIYFGNLPTSAPPFPFPPPSLPHLIMESTNLCEVAHIFRSYSLQKVSPSDPNYLNTCAMWEKIGSWVPFPRQLLRGRETGVFGGRPEDSDRRSVSRFTTF